MARVFTPRLDILPTPQRLLWQELSTLPPTFVLYGGTAIALHLGHRESVDFDFFSSEDLDPGRLALRDRLVAAVRKVDLDRLPTVTGPPR
jgi:hypothetical protein